MVNDKLNFKIPDEWKIKHLDDFGNIVSGGTPSTAVSEYWNGLISWCTPSDITRTDGTTISETEKTITNEGLKNSAAIILPIGSLLLCSRATIGDSKINAIPMATNQGFKNIIPFKETCVKYLYYLLQTKKKEMFEKATASTFAEISKSALCEIALQTPQKKEQEIIAEVLSDIDALIVDLQKLIRKKKNIRQGTMQMLLTGKKRLDGFNKEWKNTTLDKICDIKDGTHQTPHYVESGIPFYSVETVTNDDFIHVKYISLVEHERLTSSYKIENGDVLMTRIGSIGKGKYVDWYPNASFYVSLALLKFRGKKSLANFIALLTGTEEFQKEAELHSLQFAIPMKINLGQISDIRVTIPTDDYEIEAIVEVLSNMDNEIKWLEKKLNKYKNLKQGMMEELLTGKVRLI